MDDTRSQNSPRPARRFGIIVHTFPEMTPIETAFLYAFVVCGCLLTLLIERGTSSITSGFWVVALCASVMGTTLGYWMRHEPEAWLDLLVSWYSIPTGRVRHVCWPRTVVFGVRAFGVMAFFGTLISFAVAVLPDHPTSSPGPALLLYPIVLAVSFVALRKRPREK
jgi:lysylphosphatidylglycerol synthetase-like protein (DUF2156 family)